MRLIVSLPSFCLVVCAFVLMIVPISSAQDDTPCTIDVNPAIQLLLTAQSTALSGDSDSTLAQVAQAQTSLIDLQSACGVAPALDPAYTAPVALTETFTAPNFYFSVDYPQGWTAGNFIATSGDELTSIGLGSRVMITNRDNFSFCSSPALGVQSFTITIGQPAAALHLLSISATLEGISDLTSASQRFIEAVQSFAGIGLVEELQMNGQSAIRIGAFYNSDSQNAASLLALMIEVADGRIAIVWGCGAPGEELQLMQMTDALAATIR